MEDAVLDDLLKFWFSGTDAPRLPGYKHPMALWWGHDQKLTEELGDRFSALIAHAASLQPDPTAPTSKWRDSTRGCLGLIVLWRLAQRCLGPHSAATCRAAATARLAATQICSDGLSDLCPVEKIFVYEALASGEDATEIRKALEDLSHLGKQAETQPSARAVGGLVAKRLTLVEKFGRDPHLNAALERANTESESNFLQFGAVGDEDEQAGCPAKAKLLVLHGLGQNGTGLRKKTNKLRSTLRGLVELIYPDAPNPAPEGSATVSNVWWTTQQPDKQPTAEQHGDEDADGERVYAGADVSLASLRNLAERHGGFDGVLGFSQGAVLGAIAAHRNILGKNLKFVVCISGFPPRDGSVGITGPVELPSMHIWGMQDQMVAPQRSQQLAELFQGAITLPHSRGHFTPLAWPYDALREFVEEHLEKGGGLQRVPSLPPAPDSAETEEGLTPCGVAEVGWELLRHEVPVTRETVQDLVDSSLEQGEDVGRRGLMALAWRSLVAHHKTTRKIVGPGKYTQHQQYDPTHYLDLFVHTWLSVYLALPTQTLPTLRDVPVLGGWFDLCRIAVEANRRKLGVAHPSSPTLVADLPEASQQLLSELHDAIATLFADQLRLDAEACFTAPYKSFLLQRGPRPEQEEAMTNSTFPSHCAWGAPRHRSFTDKECGLARKVAALINPWVIPPDASDETVRATKGHCNERYRVMVAELSKLLDRTTASFASRELLRVRKEAAQRFLAARTAEAWEAQLEKPVSEAILHPAPEPVVPSSASALSPVLQWLSAKIVPDTQLAFPRGTAVPDGRLDLCKQVVGPMGVSPLMESLSANPGITRLLLGNNIVGDKGAEAMAKLIKSGQSPLTTWYIAGNEFTAQGLSTFCEAVAHDDKVDALWLKRNPLMPQGGDVLAKLLHTNTHVVTLDVVNTGLLDAGVTALVRALEVNHTLQHLYLGANGCSPAVTEVFRDLYLKQPLSLRSLSFAVNRLGDAGATILAEVVALPNASNLERLSLASNRISAPGATALAQSLSKASPALVFMDLGFSKSTVALNELGNNIGDVGATAFADALQHNTSLRSLSLIQNNISTVGAEALSAATNTNTTLTTLDLATFGLEHSRAVREALSAALKRNKKADPSPATQQLFRQIELPDHIAEIYSVYRTK